MPDRGPICLLSIRVSAFSFKDDQMTPSVLETILSFGCLIYYIVTLTFRLCFLKRQYEPFTGGFEIGVLIDYLVDFFFLLHTIPAFVALRKVLQSNTVVPFQQQSGGSAKLHFHAASSQVLRKSLALNGNGAIAPDIDTPAQPARPLIIMPDAKGKVPGVNESISLSARFSYKLTATGSVLSEPGGQQFSGRRKFFIAGWLCLWHFILLCPFEVIGYAVGMQHYHWLRGIRLLRCVYFHRYWAGVKQLLAAYKLIQSAGAQRIVYISLVMALIAHVSACAFYALAITEMEHGTGTTWLSEDNLVELEESQTGGSGGSTVRTLHMLRPLRFRYLRAVYWSVQTLTSVAFGDITAFTEAETWYCVVFFYLAALLVYFSIANLTMVITSRDSAKTENLVRIAKFEEYAAYRRLPLELTNRVVSYYEYQWERLQGIEEEQVCMSAFLLLLPLLIMMLLLLILLLLY